MKNFSLGLCSVSFRQNTPSQILASVKNVGLDCIEWGSDVHAPYNNIDVLNNIADLQKKYDIFCSSYGTYFCIMRDKTEDIVNYINAAKILGTNVLRVWCGEKGSSQFSESEKQELFAQCKKLAQIAKNEGATLCMECHAGTFTDTAESSIELMENVNSPNFKMYWQPYIKLSDKENVETAKMLSPYTENIHVFYWVNKKPQNLSNGSEVWREYLKNFSDKRALLLEFMPDGKIESLAKEAQALKKIIL
ncbi:MAG: sugar phosphate isomerase/epimerase [Clostridia bacterium]|nr:sugar phosphate isomerase/epimerase [Clostridia bacterium]